jgi:threonyl-tRNA synthetase
MCGFMDSSLYSLRQSAAALLGYALARLFPHAQIVQSSQTSTGFYCDIIYNETLDSQALSLIEEQIASLSRQAIPIETREMMRENAGAWFAHQGYPLKAERARTASSNLISLIQIEDYAEIASPPFLSNSAEITHVKLFDVTPLEVFIPHIGLLQVTRIQGSAFFTSQDLKKFTKTRADALHKEHRSLGQEMQLFHLDTLSGSCYWLPSGIRLCANLRKVWEDVQKEEPHLLLSTPYLNREESLRKGKKKESGPLLQTTAHEIDYTIGTNPTPFHLHAFQKARYTEKQLPVRYAEWFALYQDTPPGALQGLFTPRTALRDFVQIFCLPKQLLQNLISSLQLIENILKIFGIEYCWYFVPGTHKKNEDNDSSLLREALNTLSVKYTLDNHAKKRYGTRVEVRFIDTLKRTWPGPYIEIATELTKQMDLVCEGSQGAEQPVSLITRSLYGSMELLTALLVEHYAGRFPMWLAPEPLRILTVSERNAPYALSLVNALQQNSWYCATDLRDSPIREKVHRAELARIPYVLIVGDKEEKNKTINLRSWKKEKVEQNLSLEALLIELHQEASTLK